MEFRLDSVFSKSISGLLVSESGYSVPNFEMPLNFTEDIINSFLIYLMSVLALCIANMFAHAR